MKMSDIAFIWPRETWSVSAVPSTTSQHIGSMGRKRKLLFTDAYGGGEQSSKHARADAVLAAANAACRVAPPPLPLPLL